MLEIPEAQTIAAQLEKTIQGKTIRQAVAGASHHGFAFYNGGPSTYGAILEGKTITGVAAYGGRPEIWAEDFVLSFSDGVNVRYFETCEHLPAKHQLLLTFTDDSALVCTVQMYGGLWLFPEGTNTDFYYTVAKEKPSPLSDGFSLDYFLALLTPETKKCSAKAFLATEQRIPGLGNGVLQDILWQARIHPKTKMQTLPESAVELLFRTVKNVLETMTAQGGRDTEKDLFGRTGGYQTVMSKKNEGMLCPACGGIIRRMAYLGGNVYVCESCQKTGK